jgi:hypothetical protein
MGNDGRACGRAQIPILPGKQRLDVVTQDEDCWSRGHAGNFNCLKAASLLCRAATRTLFIHIGNLAIAELTGGLKLASSVLRFLTLLLHFLTAVLPHLNVFLTEAFHFLDSAF